MWLSLVPARDRQRLLDDELARLSTISQIGHGFDRDHTLGVGRTREKANHPFRIPDADHRILFRLGERSDRAERIGEEITHLCIFSFLVFGFDRWLVSTHGTNYHTLIQLSACASTIATKLARAKRPIVTRKQTGLLIQFTSLQLANAGI